jgi:hypothetical protein
MDTRFTISKGFLKFVVSIEDEHINVETLGTCKYQDRVCDTFAQSQQLLIIYHLREKKIKTDRFFEEVTKYCIERKWSITSIRKLSIS